VLKKSVPNILLIITFKKNKDGGVFLK